MTHDELNEIEVRHTALDSPCATGPTEHDFYRQQNLDNYLYLAEHDVPALVAEVRRLQARLAEAEAAEKFAGLILRETCEQTCLAEFSESVDGHANTCGLMDRLELTPTGAALAARAKETTNG